MSERYTSSIDVNKLSYPPRPRKGQHKEPGVPLPPIVDQASPEIPVARSIDDILYSIMPVLMNMNSTLAKLERRLDQIEYEIKKMRNQ